METDAYLSNLKTVKELILDEHKLVTYISLSKELCIHVNEAKSLLCQIIKDIRKAQPEAELYVCYLISGLLDNNRGCTTVCSEEEIEALRKTLKVVFYQHVYCVSRGLSSVDNVALTTINKFEDLTLCTGLIKASSCIKRSDDEIGNLISNNHAAITDNQKPSIAHQKNSKNKVKEDAANMQTDAIKVSELKSETKIKTEIPSPKKVEPKVSPRKNSAKPNTKSIAGFFNKVNNDSTKVKSAKVHDAEVKVIPSKTDNRVVSKAETNRKDFSKVDTKEEDSCNAATDRKTSSKAETNVKNSSKTKINRKNSKDNIRNSDTLSQIKKNAKVDKKRKRLLHVSDSESEAEETDPFSTNEMDVDHDSEDEIPPTPTINTVKITSGIVNPKKRRKIVDKTYTDEEGYILTKKVEVYESCSDNDEEMKENNKQKKENGIVIKDTNTEVKDTKTNKALTEEVKQIKSETSPKGNSKNKKKKITPPKGKQSTINSFFKKA